jgi:hypothetical protein
MTWPALTGAAFEGVFEWNVARTWRLSGGSDFRVPTPLQARILTALQGAWVASGDTGCRPLKGGHAPGCRHGMNAVPVRVGVLAEWMFAQTGGSQRTQVRKALNELAGLRITYRLYVPGGGFATATGPLIELGGVGDDLRLLLWKDGIEAKPDLVVRFSKPLFDGLREGHYQRIPLRLVQGLSGEDYLLWLTVLCQVPVSRLKKGSEPVTLSLTGRKPAIGRWQYGCRSLMGSRLAATVERAILRGNELQEKVRLELVELEPNRGRLKRRLSLRASHWTRAKGVAAEPHSSGSPAGVLRQSDAGSAARRDIGRRLRLDKPTSSVEYGKSAGSRGVVGEMSVRRPDGPTVTPTPLRHHHRSPVWTPRRQNRRLPVVRR